MSDRLRGKRLVMVLVLMLTACTASTVQRPNVLIVVLDTLRADRVSCYGYDRPTTPHIDALWGVVGRS
jgi:glucan phosphoethanolaminetransferase (alkaline phosphatase superfamily)